MRTSLAQIKHHIAFLGFWTLLWGLFFATIGLGWERFPSSDFSGQFHAFGLFQAREMLSGQLPLWSPGSQAGFPFAADIQSATFYPPRWLTIFASAPWHFPLLALEWEALLHVWLAGTFVYGLLYAITRQRSAGLLGAVAFGLGGYLASYPLLQLAILETISWCPLVLWLLRQGIMGQMAQSHRIRWLVGAGLALGMSALAGHPQTFLHVATLSAAYYLFLAIRAGWGWQWVVEIGLLLAGIGGGVAAVAYLPALHLASYTTRREVSYQFVSGGLPMLDYVQLWLPGVLSFWLPQYVGGATLLLGIIAIKGRKFSPQAAELLFWAGVAGFAAWLALGDAGILFELTYYLLPGFSLFRQQERWLGIFSLSAAILAGQGLAIWLSLQAKQRRLLFQQVLSFFLLAAAVCTVLVSASQTVTRPWLPILLRQLLVWGGSILLLWASLRYRWLILFLIAGLGADLYIATYEGIGRQVGSPADYWVEPDWLVRLRQELPANARIDSGNLFHANVGEIYGLEDVHGISPLTLQTVADFQGLPAFRQWQLLGVTHLLSYDPPHPSLTRVAEIDQNIMPDRTMDAAIFGFDQALPRAWLTYQPVVVESPPQALAQLADPAFDPAQQVVLYKEIPGLETVKMPAQPPTVTPIRQSSRAWQIRVATEQPGVLVISEWIYPGWRARLDGQPVELFTVDYTLLGVVVPAGSHTLDLYFLPTDIFLGMGITLLTLVGSWFIASRSWQITITSQQRVAKSPQPLFTSNQQPLWQLFQRAAASKWLLLLLLLGFALRVHQLGVQEIRGDEGYSYPFTQIPFLQVLPTLAPVGEEHAPVHYLLLNGWVDLAGDSEFSMRYLAVIPGLLALPLIFQLGRYLASIRLALLLAGVFTLSQSLIWLSQDVRNQYAMTIAVTTWATLLLVRAVARPSWGRWAIYALACSLTMYSHYYGVFALLAHGFYIFAKVRQPLRSPILGQWLVSGVVAALSFAPWIWVTFAGWVGQFSEASHPDLGSYLSTVGQELVVGPAFRYGLGRWFFVLAVIVMLFGWRTMSQKNRAWAALLASWCLLATLGVFVVFLRRAVFNAYYIAPAAPAWWALWGYGVMVLWQSRVRWRQGLALLGVVTVMSAGTLSLFHYYSDPITYGRTRGYRAVADYLTAQAREGDAFVANFPDPSLNYYLRHLILPKTLQPAQTGEPAHITEQALGELSQQFDRLWFVPENGQNWDGEQIALRWLDYHTLVEQSGKFTNLHLFAYRPEHALEQVLSPLPITLPNGIGLEGVFLAVNGQPAAEGSGTLVVPAHARLALTLVWKAHAPISTDYTAFVHLLAADGFLLAQHDGVPMFGTRPTTGWQVGERLIDRHELELPASLSGEGQLVIGLYETSSQTRLPFADYGETVLIRPIRWTTP